MVCYDNLNLNTSNRTLDFLFYFVRKKATYLNNNQTAGVSLEFKEYCLDVDTGFCSNNWPSSN